MPSLFFIHTNNTSITLPLAPFMAITCWYFWPYWVAEVAIAFAGSNTICARN